MKLAGIVKPSGRLSHLRNLRERDLSEDIRIRYLGREKEAFRFQVGGSFFSIEDPRRLQVLDKTVQIRAATAYGGNSLEVRVEELANPQMSYFGRTEARVTTDKREIAVCIDCKGAAFQSLDVKKGEIIIKIRISREHQGCQA